MSSKSILIILSYTVSKFALFLRHSVHAAALFSPTPHQPHGEELPSEQQDDA